METRRYTILVTASLVCPMLVVLVLSWTWVRQPQTGDLARIGGYVESRYESRGDEPRMAFARPLFVSLQNHGGGPFDVLVLGDSFSYTGGRYNWVSQFAALSGLSVRVASIHRWWEALHGLESDGALPPLIIIQSVERDVVDHLANMNHRLGRSKVDPPQTATSIALPIAVPGPEQGLTRAPLPPKSFGSFDERISVTVDVLWKSLRRRIGLPRDEVVVFAAMAANPRYSAPSSKGRS